MRALTTTHKVLLICFCFFIAIPSGMALPKENKFNAFRKSLEVTKICQSLVSDILLFRDKFEKARDHYETLRSFEGFNSKECQAAVNYIRTMRVVLRDARTYAKQLRCRNIPSRVTDSDTDFDEICSNI